MKRFLLFFLLPLLSFGAVEPLYISRTNSTYYGSLTYRGNINNASLDGGFVLGGVGLNKAYGFNSGIIGGGGNTISNGPPFEITSDSFIIGSVNSYMLGLGESLIMGGSAHCLLGFDSIILGGTQNYLDASQSMIGGGDGNSFITSGSPGTILGSANKFTNSGLVYVYGQGNVATNLETIAAFGFKNNPSAHGTVTIGSRGTNTTAGSTQISAGTNRLTLATNGPIFFTGTLTGDGAGLSNVVGTIAVATNLTDWNRLVVTNTVGTANVLITNGQIAASASIDSTGGSVRAGTAGGASTPSLGWNTDASGFYHPSAGSIHVTASGANMVSFNTSAPMLVVSNGMTLLLGTLSAPVGTFSTSLQSLNYLTVTNAVGDIARPNMAISTTYFSTNNNVVFVGLLNVPASNPGVEAYHKVVITNTAANKTVAFPAMWNISGGSSQTLSNIGTLKIWALAGVYTNAEWVNHK